MAIQYCEISLSEYNELKDKITTRPSHLNMLKSKHGPGVFSLTQKTIPGHDIRYSYDIRPNSNDRTIGHGGYFTDPEEAIQHAHDEHEVFLKRHMAQ